MPATVKAKINVSTDEVTFNMENLQEILKFDDKLTFPNSSTHLWSKATQTMHSLTKEKLSKKKYVVSIFAYETLAHVLLSATV